MKKTFLNALVITLFLLFSINSYAASETEDALISTGEAVRGVRVENQFDDIEAEDWYYYSANYLAEIGINIGESEILFNGEADVTPSEVFDILYRMEMDESSAESESVVHKYEKAISWAISNKIVTSDSDMIFKPDETITREQLFSLFYQYAGYDGIDITYNEYLANYADGSSVRPEMAEAFNWAISNGLLTDNDTDMLDPKAKVTRAELSNYLYLYIQNIVRSSDENLDDNYGLHILYPSDLQSVIEQGRDFYVIAEFVGNIDIPTDAYTEIKITSLTDDTVYRTVYCEKKNDTDNLNLDYPGLRVWGMEKEEFREAGMPDLVYDKNDESTFANTWIKCFYNDTRVTATVYGGLYQKDVNLKDQYGQPLTELPEGEYMVNVTVSSSDHKEKIAYAEEKIEIGRYPDKIISPFLPMTHFDRIHKYANEMKYEIFLDPFPGYWDFDFIHPSWNPPGINYSGTIAGKWRYMDATEYNTGNVHYYIYDVGAHSTSYICEIGEIESKDGNLDRVSCYYYDIGEPVIGQNRGNYVKMNLNVSPVAFTRIDYLTNDTTLGDNIVDMESFQDVTIHRLSVSNSVVCSAGQVLGLYGVCAPVMSTEPLVMNDYSTFDLNNRIEKIVYKLEPITGGEVTTLEKTVSLERKNYTETLEAPVGLFEFKHDITIPEEWQGKSIKITYSAYDSLKNTVVENAEGPVLYVLRE